MNIVVTEDTHILKSGDIWKVVDYHNFFPQYVLYITGPHKCVIEHVTLHILLPLCHSKSEKLLLRLFCP